MKEQETTLFNTIQQTPNLRSGLVDTLIAQIESGDLAPGQRLPTEQAIMTATGVSRTVVREALASLRAKGLITTRQGLGAFVSDDPTPRSFSIIPTDLESIDDVLRILELRMGIEVEAAGLAARRRTQDDVERMASRLDALEKSIQAGGPGAEEDFGFHRAILVATQNSYYARLFDTFGSTMVPRQWVRFDTMDAAERQKHVARMQREHRAILSAIRDQDERAAQKAVRTHLTKSSARFVELRDRARTGES
ncbi:FadR/GntR family transcriptional regulator [Phyllobacterium endophyticum]|uniref:FadR/GntR family transcriptional regulator n=1 Tax=Phyllobacterium endophyticum TaxID=1149773 RepID=UPI0011C7E579|nr:FadR/GntR family transcriptional regulator [Phyllobacterium endophyticum]TXR47639.1 FadR family transcriptional regulator [Phyllobacterium endophyticum]